MSPPLLPDWCRPPYPGLCEPCGHPWMRHDVNEYSGDGSETCCVEGGCTQNGCPGRRLAAAEMAP